MRCSQCPQIFYNAEEVDEHVNQVHSDKWRGAYLFGEAGDENADGAISPYTADFIATEGGLLRMTALERAAENTRTPGAPDSSHPPERPGTE